MLELLILYILHNDNKSIYTIRKTITAFFSVYAKPSFGSIHPALKKLEKNNCVKVENKISSGGQLKSLYSITNEGKTRFIELLREDYPANIPTAKQLCDIKLLMLSTVEEDVKELVIYKSISLYEKYRLTLLKLKDAYALDSGKMQRKIIETEADFANQKIQWLKTMV